MLGIGGGVSVEVPVTTDLDEARDLGEVDEDPPTGDYNDAASIALVSLATDCGLMEAGSHSTVFLLGFVRSVIRALRGRSKDTTLSVVATEGEVDHG